MTLGAMARDVCASGLGRGRTARGAWTRGGGAAAWWLTAISTASCIEVTPADVASYVGAGALLTIVAMLATLVPARRAARIEPMRALRDEYGVTAW